MLSEPLLAASALVAISKLAAKSRPLEILDIFIQTLFLFYFFRHSKGCINLRPSQTDHSRFDPSIRCRTSEEESALIFFSRESCRSCLGRVRWSEIHDSVASSETRSAQTKRSFCT